MDAANGSVSDTVSHKPDASIDADIRSQRSRRALDAAMLGLLETTPFDQITVRAIVAAAGIHYATFFRHYSGKEALLDHLAAEQIAALVELTLPVLDRAGGHAALVALCRHVDRHRRLWTILLTGGAAAAMRAELLGIARQVAAERIGDGSHVPVALAVRCAVGLIFETLAWWLGEAPSVPEAEAATVLGRLLEGIRAGEDGPDWAVETTGGMPPVAPPAVSGSLRPASRR